jgi:hypothetical protein
MGSKVAAGRWIGRGKGAKRRGMRDEIIKRANVGQESTRRLRIWDRRCTCSARAKHEQTHLRAQKTNRHTSADRQTGARTHTHTHRRVETRYIASTFRRRLQPETRRPCPSQQQRARWCLKLRQITTHVHRPSFPPQTQTPYIQQHCTQHNRGTHRCPG